MTTKEEGDCIILDQTINSMLLYYCEITGSKSLKVIFKDKALRTQAVVASVSVCKSKMRGSKHRQEKAVGTIDLFEIGKKSFLLEG